ncbi:GTP-binding protein HflX [Aphelenchoides avenae]|nr:GTP-binding protein HflX [Aphelenchus avenae]
MVEEEYARVAAASGFASIEQAQLANRSERVLLLHPKIRWGPNSTPKNTTPELQMEEAKTLVQTLRGFTVVSSVMVGTDRNTKKKLMWGKGRLERLMEHKASMNVTSIMVNVRMLTPVQQQELSKYFGVPVFDRYNIVLWIFKLYAKTAEARLQISLAEIPYIRHRLTYLDRHSVKATPETLQIDQAVHSIASGSQDKFEVLRLREHALKKKIKEAVDAKKTDLEKRLTKGPNKTAVIAVIGYTNAGKTTFIKKLTGATSIFGENRLFATLDTTAHEAVLPSRNRAVFADTIGFISDLPVGLFASFSATLSHVVNADLLVHIQDLSHPDVVAQRDNVYRTLEGLKMDARLMDTMINVGNKVDRVIGDSLPEKALSDDMCIISCRTGEGVNELIQRIDTAVIAINGGRLRRFHLHPHSKLIPYLYGEGLVSSEPIPSEDGQKLTFDLYLNDQQLAKLQSHMTNSIKLSKG